MALWDHQYSTRPSSLSQRTLQVQHHIGLCRPIGIRSDTTYRSRIMATSSEISAIAVYLSRRITSAAASHRLHEHCMANSPSRKNSAASPIRRVRLIPCTQTDQEDPPLPVPIHHSYRICQSTAVRNQPVSASAIPVRESQDPCWCTATPTKARQAQDCELSRCSIHRHRRPR